METMISNECNIQEIKGDLFVMKDKSSLAHCISSDYKVGRGIALKFRNVFQQENEVRSQDKKAGHAIALQSKGHFIYYLVVKDVFNYLIHYEDLQSAIEEMKCHALANNVKEISMPRLGCGLDRLDWRKVKDILINIFLDTSIQIKVYDL